MYHGKYVSQRRRRRSKRPGILLASIVLILGIAISTTAAFLVDNTEGVTNTFTAANVTVEVEENFSNNVKKDVYLRNTGNTSAYVRATVVEYWMNSAGEVVQQPTGCERDIDWANADDWVVVDEVYYYKNPLKPQSNNSLEAGDCTTNLINTVTVKITGEYTYHLDVFAEAIQASPTTAVTTKWPDVTVNSDGTLSMKQAG